MVLRVRELTIEEGQKLQRILRHGQNAIEFKRAQIVLASAQGFSPPKISLIALMSEDYIREVILAFNEHGMAMLQPKWGPGRPPKFTEEQRKALVDLALSRPKDLGLPYAQWSLSRLREQAVARGLVESISEEWLRVILHEDEVSHQSIRTWKTSPDPLVEEKKRRIDRLTRARHNPPVVLSSDEIGPIQRIPHGGQGWFPEKRPARIPAEYEREFGTVYYFLTLNVFHQRLFGRVYRTKHSVNWLDYLKDVRARYPPDRWLNLIWDSASNHGTAEIRAWARANKVRLFATPTHASHLNPVECHAGDLQKLALPGQT
ncbi:transposase, partial [mine drainage metagenome]